MYALIINQVVSTYPYSIGQLRKDNPNVSFPKNPSDTLLASWNVFPVTSVDPVYNEATQIATENGCVYNEELQRWETGWTVRDKTAEELAAEAEKAANNVRRERTRLLAECDWTQLADAPVDKEAWATYRQALRDITAQEGFPSTVTWPTPPS